MLLNILQNIFQEVNEDLTTIGTLVAQFGIEHFVKNADRNDRIQEEFHVESKEQEMEWSDTESDDLYDNSHEQSKIKVQDCIISTNVHAMGFRI